MQIAEAQAEVRSAFAGGSAGQFVSGVLWLVSAALATWGTPRSAIIVLVVGGFFIFPVTQAVVRLFGRSGKLSPGNALNGLAMQVAFVLPLSLPLVAGATAHRLEWFYPSFMILVGAHYLPFVFLYGMRVYAGLCALLVGSGIYLGLYRTDSFAAGGWVTGGVLLAFAAMTLQLTLAQERRVHEA